MRVRRGSGAARLVRGQERGEHVSPDGIREAAREVVGE
jgi:hypothetical protein